MAVLPLRAGAAAYIVLPGADMKAGPEAQTALDTTMGSEQPQCRRGAVKVDTSPEEVADSTRVVT